LPEIDGIMLPFMPAGGVRDLKKYSSPVPSAAKGLTFEDVFKDELSRLKFSGHANSRMTSRDISLNDNEMIRLESAVGKAEEKGAVESLVIMDGKAFIVNIPNKTVVTVVSRDGMKDKVITNIDSAVFA
jgi:flagellar operon protein